MECGELRGFMKGKAVATAQQICNWIYTSQEKTEET